MTVGSECGYDSTSSIEMQSVYANMTWSDRNLLVKLVPLSHFICTILKLIEVHLCMKTIGCLDAIIPKYIYELENAFYDSF